MQLQGEFMKVMLMVNLKLAKGRVLPKGAIFTDEYKPFPGFIQRKIGTPLVQVLEDKIKHEVVEIDDFTMETPEPKQEEIMIEVDRYVEPVEEVKEEIEKEYWRDGVMQADPNDIEEEPEPEQEVEEPEEEEEVEEPEQEEEDEPVRKRRTRKKKDTDDESSKKRRGRKKKVE